MTLAQKYRLGPKDFDLVKEKGKVFQSTSFAISYLRKPNQSEPHIGIVVSKKISNHASVRNKAKRALSEGTRRCLALIKPDYDYIFLAKPIIIKKYTAELMAEVPTAFEQAGLFQ